MPENKPLSEVILEMFKENISLAITVIGILAGVACNLAPQSIEPIITHTITAIAGLATGKALYEGDKK